MTGSGDSDPPPGIPIPPVIQCCFMKVKKMKNLRKTPMLSILLLLFLLTLTGCRDPLPEAEPPEPVPAQTEEPEPESRCFDKEKAFGDYDGNGYDAKKKETDEKLGK